MVRVTFLFVMASAGVSAFCPYPMAFTRQQVKVYGEDPEHSEKGAGGMFDTRNPDPKDDPDPRKSISVAPSFEEYLKQRQAEQK